MRTRSPGCSGAGPPRTSSLRNVPLVEPRSSMTMTLPWRTICAWREDANGSSSRISACSPRPSTAPSWRSYSIPGACPGARSTIKRGSLAIGATALCRPVSSDGGAGSTHCDCPPCPGTRRRSFIPLRETHSRNRNSTATKPNLSATDAGSMAARNTTSGHLERRVDRAERDVVAGRQRLRLAGGHARAVDADAVRRAEVGDRPLAVRAGPQLGVLAGHVGVAEDDLALAAAADRRAGRRHRVALALGDEHGPPGARGALLG